MRMPSEFNLQPGFDVFPGTKSEIAMGSEKNASAVFHLLVLKDEDDDDDWRLAK